MTTVDEAREALLARDSRSRTVALIDAFEAAIRAESAETLAVLRELLREAIEAYHRLDNIRDHADPLDKTGWHVKGIETCRDGLCVDALAALAATPEAER